MKTYLKYRTNWVLFVVMFMSLVIIYCSSPKEKPSRTVDEIILENRLKDSSKIDSINLDDN